MKIAIIGAGQAGLQLGIGLQKNGISTTIYSEYFAEAISSGYITSSQVMFHTALSYEKELDLNLWENEAPKNSTVRFSISGQVLGSQEINWNGVCNMPFQSVDQRIKFPQWMKIFEDFGGTIIIKSISTDDIDTLAQDYDLIIIASGKNNLNTLFEINKEASPHQIPQRAICLLAVKGMKPHFSPGISANIIPNIGEYFTTPGISVNGACEMMLFEGVPGGPLDCWNTFDHKNLTNKIDLAKNLLRQYVPWEAERCAEIELADPKGLICGSITPTIRKPFALANNGTLLIGLGDAVILNDPIAGQGSNLASRAAKIYLDAIKNTSPSDFTPEWASEVFSQLWDYAEKATLWSNILLSPLPIHIIQLLKSAEHSQPLANRLANSFDNLKDLFPWIQDPVKTRINISKYTNEFVENT